MRLIPCVQAPVMLRLVFHDAATYDAAAGDGGADASVRFELDRAENFGLKRGWRVIEAAQAGLTGTPAEGKVSAADLIALAGARAVRITGGPDIDVPIGKRPKSPQQPYSSWAFSTWQPENFGGGPHSERGRAGGAHH